MSVISFEHTPHSIRISRVGTCISIAMPRLLHPSVRQVANTVMSSAFSSSMTYQFVSIAVHSKAVDVVFMRVMYAVKPELETPETPHPVTVVPGTVDEMVNDTFGVPVNLPDGKVTATAFGVFATIVPVDPRPPAIGSPWIEPSVPRII